MSDLFLLRELPRFEYLQEKAKRTPGLDAEAAEATLALLRVGSDVLEGLSAHFERNNISQSRFLALMMVERHEDEGSTLHPCDVADKLSVTRATVTGLLDGLVRDSLISRRTHEADRRALTLHLTDKGRAYLHEMLPDHHKRVAGLMAHLSASERKTLVALLSKVAQGTNALHDPAWTPPPGIHHEPVSHQLSETNSRATHAA